ncbi:hypothetical protein EV361DRAFT_870638 [Lentinula raphanica]|nr:hypothetical protein EV361DRAFT_870638 [Lentinula raphanica]
MATAPTEHDLERQLRSDAGSMLFLALAVVASPLGTTAVPLNYDPMGQPLVPQGNHLQHDHSLPVPPVPLASQHSLRLARYDPKTHTWIDNDVKFAGDQTLYVLLDHEVFAPTRILDLGGSEPSSHVTFSDEKTIKLGPGRSVDLILSNEQYDYIKGVLFHQESCRSFLQHIPFFYRLKGLADDVGTVFAVLHCLQTGIDGFMPIVLEPHQTLEAADEIVDAMRTVKEGGIPFIASPNTGKRVGQGSSGGGGGSGGSADGGSGRGGGGGGNSKRKPYKVTKVTRNKPKRGTLGN